MIASRIMPSKQAIHVAIVSLFELLVDLVLSFIGYCALAYVVHLLIRMIADWTFYPWIMFSDRRDEIMRWIVFSLWGARIVLRWRKHLARSCGYLTWILRWLSPLYPEPYEAFPWCPTAVHVEPASGQTQRDDEYVGQLSNRRDDECMEQWSVGIFL